MANHTTVISGKKTPVAPVFPNDSTKTEIERALDELDIAIVAETPELIFIRCEATAGAGFEVGCVYAFDEGELSWGPESYWSLATEAGAKNFPADLVNILALFLETGAEEPTPRTLGQLAWELAMAPQLDAHARQLAVDLGRQANELSDWSEPAHLDSLAASLAAMGEFESAQLYQSQAIGLDPDNPEYRHRLTLYRDNERYYRSHPIDSAVLAAAEAGDAAAQFDVGTHAASHGIEVLGLPGMSWLERAAEAGHMDAQNELGFAYMHGIHGLERDPNRARQWLQRAAAGGQGDPLAAVNLALLYADPSNDFHDQQTAFQWLSRVADSGFLYAKLELAFRHGMGLGTPRDVEKQRRIIRELEQSGYEPAAYLSEVPGIAHWLGQHIHDCLSLQNPSAYELGDNVVEFARLLEAQRDNPHRHVSFSWVRGSTEYFADIAKDDLPELLLHLYNAAAKLGNTGAQRKLADHYRSGTVVARSERAARFWQGLAARLDTERCEGDCR